MPFNRPYGAPNGNTMDEYGHTLSTGLRHVATLNRALRHSQRTLALFLSHQRASPFTSAAGRTREAQKALLEQIAEFSRKRGKPQACVVVRETDRPNGAAACCHGWSTARCKAGGAQPVGAFVFQHICTFRGGGMCRTRGGSVSFRQFGSLLRPYGAKNGEKGPGPFFLIRFPRVAHRAAVRPRRSTRGNNPSPRWGETRPRPARLTVTKTENYRRRRSANSPPRASSASVAGSGTSTTRNP